MNYTSKLIHYLSLDLTIFGSKHLSISEKINLLFLQKIKYLFNLKPEFKLKGKVLKAESNYNILAIETYIKQINTIFNHTELKRRPNIVDIGAHTGIYSILLTLFYPKAKITAFEPNPITYKYLQINTKDFPSITPYNIGFSNKTIETSMLYDPLGLDSATVVQSYGKKREHKHAIMVKLKKLDTFIKKHGIKNVDLLKIDVEGHEHSLLQSAQYTLSITKYLIIEITLESEKTFSETLSLLQSNRFNFNLISIIKDWRDNKDNLRLIEILLINKNYQK